MNISNNNNTTREADTNSKITPSTSTSDSYKESASNNNDGVSDVNNMLKNMSTADDKDIIVSELLMTGIHSFYHDNLVIKDF